MAQLKGRVYQLVSYKQLDLARLAATFGEPYATWTLHTGIQGGIHSVFTESCH